MKSDDIRLHHRLVPAENHARLSGPVVEQPPSFPPADIPPVPVIESSDSLGALVEALEAELRNVTETLNRTPIRIHLWKWCELDHDRAALRRSIAILRRRASTGGNVPFSDRREEASDV